MILTDQKGLYSADPRKNRTPSSSMAARAGDPAAGSDGRRRRSRVGTGGMITKIVAARRAAAQAPRP